MKLLYLLFLLVFSYQNYAQDPVLIDETWYLQNVRIDNNDNIPPTNAEVGAIVANFTNVGLGTYFCDSLSGIIAYNANNEEFNFTQPLEQTFFGCSMQENQDFQNLYFGFFYNEQTLLFNYLISIGDDGNKTLIVTSASGNQAIYGDQILSNEVFDGSQFSIYPNPASNTVFIEANSQIENVEILDLLGRKVLEVSPLAEKTELNMGNLKAGMYIAIIFSEGKKIVKKIIKE